MAYFITILFRNVKKTAKGLSAVDRAIFYSFEYKFLIFSSNASVISLN